MSLLYHAGVGAGAFEEMMNMPIDALFQNFKYLSSVVVNQQTQALNSAAWYLQARFIQSLCIMQSRIQEAPLNILLSYANNAEEPARDVNSVPIFCLSVREFCIKELIRRNVIQEVLPL